MEDGAGNRQAEAVGNGAREEGGGATAVEARITADGSATLYSGRYGQTFHSHHGAVSESSHVFVEGSGVGERLRNGEPARVLEVGFGTGLNFLLTAQLAWDSGAELSYVALERELLSAATIASLGYQRFAPQPLPALLDFIGSLGEPTATGVHAATVPGASLELRFGDAQQAKLEEGYFDAVYHDAFSPQANPELWSDGFLGRLAAALASGGTLVTYTVKGEVRRSLHALGLRVSKAAGPPGGKREMLKAVRP